ncbi:MAG TPA: hypothetical protein VFF30_09230 [Nitrososphaerales archaeon]|nr:hypothetical protein [Nitrososphaerales archaeon]
MRLAFSVAGSLAALIPTLFVLSPIVHETSRGYLQSAVADFLLIAAVIQVGILIWVKEKI